MPNIAVFTADPDLIILYEHMRGIYKTLIMARQPSLSALEEHSFISACACSYEKLGCPSLALELINKYNLTSMDSVKLLGNACEIDESIEEAGIENTPISALDWNASPIKESAGLDWSEMESTIPDNGLDFSEMESAFDKADDEGGADDFAEFYTTNALVETAKFVPASGTKEAVEVSLEDYTVLSIERESIDEYRRILVLRLLKPVVRSARIMFTDSKTPFLANYFANTRQAFEHICHISGIKMGAIYDIFVSSCFESCSLDSYVALAPCFEGLHNESKCHDLFVTYSSYLNSQILIPGFLDHSTSKLTHVDDQAVKLMNTWICWTELGLEMPYPKLSESCNIIVVMSSFFIRVITSVLVQNQDRLWWMIGMSEKMCDLILKNDRNMLVSLLREMLVDKAPVAHPDDEDLDKEKFEMHDEYGIPIFRSDSKQAILTVRFVSILALRHLTLILSAFLDRINEKLTLDHRLYEAYDFLNSSVVRRVELHLVPIERQIQQEWHALGMDIGMLFVI